MKILSIISSFLIAAPCGLLNPLSAETVNELYAVVSREPITAVDIALAAEKYKNNPFGANDKRPMESQIMDVLVARAIVNQIAEEESIKVSADRINNEIKKRVKQMGLKDEAEFRRNIEKELKVSFETFTEDMEFEIKKEQLIQIRIQPERPQDAEVRKWYEENAQKVGKEINVREIIVTPAGAGMAAERAAEELAGRLKTEGMRGNFAAIAGGPENSSPYRAVGGEIGWQNLGDIAKSDLIYANMAYQLQTPGQISPVFRTGSGNYVVLQLIGNRSVPFDKVYPLIQGMLAREKQEGAFYEWIDKQRENYGVKIMMPGYQTRAGK